MAFSFSSSQEDNKVTSCSPRLFSFSLISSSNPISHFKSILVTFEIFSIADKGILSTCSFAYLNIVVRDIPVKLSNVLWDNPELTIAYFKRFFS